MLNEFMIFIIASAVITVIVNLLKEAIDTLHEKNWLIFCITSALGILLMIAFDGDFFNAFGYSSAIPYVGHVCSGVVVGGGSNAIYELLSLIKNGRQTTKELLDYTCEECDFPDYEDEELKG